MDRCNFLTTKVSKDDEKVLDNFHCCGKDRKVYDNIPLISSLHDLPFVCSRDDPKEQKVEEAEAPKSQVTFFDCCTNLTSYLCIVYQKSCVFHLNLYLVTSECFDFSNHVPDGSTDFGFAVDDRDLLQYLQVGEVFQLSVI